VGFPEYRRKIAWTEVTGGQREVSSVGEGAVGIVRKTGKAIAHVARVLGCKRYGVTPGKPSDLVDPPRREGADR
jgi:hypothetical protein